MKRILGFSLIEVLMIFALVAILAAVAYPSYRSFMQNTRVTTVTNEFMSALSYARSEAVKRNTSVTVCPAANSSYTSCGNSSAWSNGWIIFLDADADGVLANNSDRFKVHDALDTGSTITTTQARITYSRSGFVSSGVGSFTITVPGCSGNSARLITLTATGVATVTNTACTLP